MKLFENITKATLIIFDELKDDSESKDIIQMIDESEDDSNLQKGLRLALEKLEVLGKITLVSDLRDKLKGFI